MSIQTTKLKQFIAFFSVVFLSIIFLSPNGAGWWDEEWHYRIPITVEADIATAHYPIYIETNLDSGLHTGALDKSSIIVIREDSSVVPFSIDFKNDQTPLITFNAFTEKDNVDTTYYVYYDTDFFLSKNMTNSRITSYGFSPYNTDINFYEDDIDEDGVEDIIASNTYYKVIISGRSGEIISYTNKKYRRELTFTFSPDDEDCVEFRLPDSKNNAKKIVLKHEKLTIDIESILDSPQEVKGRSATYKYTYTMRPYYPDLELTFQFKNSAKDTYNFSSCSVAEKEFVPFIFKGDISESFEKDNDLSSLPFYNLDGKKQMIENDDDEEEEILRSWIKFADILYFHIDADDNENEERIVYVNKEDNSVTVGGLELLLKNSASKTYNIKFMYYNESITPEHVYKSDISYTIGSFQHQNYCGDKICVSAECVYNCTDCDESDIPTKCAGDSMCNTLIGENCSLSEDCKCIGSKICLAGNKYADEKGCVFKGIKLENGNICTANAICDSGNCKNNICCEANQTCCAEHNDCNSGTYCNNETYYCNDTLVDGQECYYNEQCSSKNCNNGICCALGKVCCKDDTMCTTGFCVKKNFYCNIYLPNIEAEKEITKRVADINEPIDIYIKVTNVGKGLAENIEIADILPLGFSLLDENQTLSHTVSEIYPDKLVVKKYSIIGKVKGNYTFSAGSIDYYDLEETKYGVKMTVKNPDISISEIDYLITPTPTPTPVPSISVGPPKTTPPPTPTPEITLKPTPVESEINTTRDYTNQTSNTTRVGTPTVDISPTNIENKTHVTQIPVVTTNINEEEDIPLYLKQENIIIGAGGFITLIIIVTAIIYLRPKKKDKSEETPKETYTFVEKINEATGQPYMIAINNETGEEIWVIYNTEAMRYDKVIFDEDTQNYKYEPLEDPDKKSKETETDDDEDEEDDLEEEEEDNEDLEEDEDLDDDEEDEEELDEDKEEE